jgi:hypothetical protein
MADADASKVKNIEYLKKLTDYLNRVRPYIPNYAMRAHLGFAVGNVLSDVPPHRSPRARLTHEAPRLELLTF